MPTHGYEATREAANDCACEAGVNLTFSYGLIPQMAKERCVRQSRVFDGRIITSDEIEWPELVRLLPAESMSLPLELLDQLRTNSAV